MVNFELGKDVEKYVFFSSCRVRGMQKSIFLCIFTELKLYHLKTTFTPKLKQ